VKKWSANHGARVLVQFRWGSYSVMGGRHEEKIAFVIWRKTQNIWIGSPNLNVMTTCQSPYLTIA